VTRDGYDLVGYRAFVDVAEDVRPAVRSILSGFGPHEFEPALSIPTYDLAEASEGWHIRRGGTTLQIERTPEHAVDVLEWHLVAAALAHRRDLFHLHGAALSVPGDRGAIILTGDSGSGKTTLTLGLINKGFVPFADDVALLDPASLHMHPLRRAFRVSDQTRRLLGPLAGRTVGRIPDIGQDYHAPPVWAAGTVPVRWILVLEYLPEQAGRVVPLSASEAATAILSRTSSLTHEARLALSTCKRLIERAVCCRLFTGDLEASMTAAQALVSRPVAAQESATV
jgi:hypothetical protein